MDLVPFSDSGRKALVDVLNTIPDNGVQYKKIEKTVDYVVKTFPNLLLDVAYLFTEQATANARASDNSAKANLLQLKPFFTFGFLLGKAPQVTSLMYTYFENSSFQPLPENMFHAPSSPVSPDAVASVVYNLPGLDDSIVIDILISYLKYLSFNPKWFSAVWNWAELARLITIHPVDDIRYLAACCLSIITKPSRHQHVSLMQDVIPNPQTLINMQIKYSYVFENTFRPRVETKAERASEFVNIYGKSQTGYQFSADAITKVANVLLLKRDVRGSERHKSKITKIRNRFVQVATICDTVSKIAYAASINRPCLIRGPTGCGKTAILDYIAAHTNRIIPPDYVKVQVGDQIDSKSLVGSYVCTEIPGQFEWQPGPLTQAMTYGSWIVFEDIDSAPSEMAQVIHSVIENGNLSCVSSCPIKLDNPHPDFRIFFTQRTRGSSHINSLKLGFGFIERLCDIVDMPELSNADLKEILESRYQFGLLRETILQLYRTSENHLTDMNTSDATRVVTFRDLFKFCDRVSSRTLKVKDGKYSSQDLDALLADAIDCFIASLPGVRIGKLAEDLGQVLNKSPVEIKVMLSRKSEPRNEGSTFSIGRAKLEASKSAIDKILVSRTAPASTLQTIQLMERVCLSINYREPVLLVGETGVGKTTIVQYLADVMGTELVVINLSQQSDSADLLGGFRPVELRDIVKPIHEKFVDLFGKTYDLKENETFMSQAESLFIRSKKCSEWLIFIKLLCKLCSKAVAKQNLTKDVHDQWGELLNSVRKLSTRLADDSSSPMALSFSEGSLLTAVRKGHWVLLDEINLAEPDVLQCLLLILDSFDQVGTHIYFHGGGSRDGKTFVHPNFRLFACMNPSTDIGKRDLPIGVRGRFTEYFVDDVTEVHDLRLIVESYVKTCLKPPQIESIVKFYREIRSKSNTLSDISGNSPIYSLRTLCRALVICSQNVCRNMERSLLESFKITFLQQLNEASVRQVLKLMDEILFKGTSLKSIMEVPIQKPADSHQYIQVEGFWIQVSSQPRFDDENYILTKSVMKNLERISRILCLGQRRLPILIQGDTSVGKTSLIKYLAKLSGNMCYRINNHEHTDLQEYIGRYVLRENGELQFQEGLLVSAMRKGYWVILDELNLAPCELLEALNRVLDDNRELFIPETGETIKAHSKFALFATQNPPQEYAGRKLLSKAFRNRFVEIHFDTIPHDELEEILQRRCKMAPQHAKKIVTVMRDLQVYRRESGCFGGKSSFMTMRDLFRWGERYATFAASPESDKTEDWNHYLACEGLVLLEGRVRTLTEADTVKEIIEKVFKTKLDRTQIYRYVLPALMSVKAEFQHIHFTQEFRRLYTQLSKALKYREPVLLCGQTGCGKTTACQLYADLAKQNLIIYNCHLNTESSDFVGNVRPSRGSKDSRQMFPWKDGPLVQAMKEGSLFLMDEISLADDAVLERINSVLEPDRSITLTELDGQEIVANRDFRLVATMNPGGDYGKKELSPALRNRFTEIYCHNTTDMSQIISIIEKSLAPALLKPMIAPSLLKVMKQFLGHYYRGQNIISLRDVLSWAKFLNITTNIARAKPLSIHDAIINGACLVFFDQFGTCGHQSGHSGTSDEHRETLMNKLEKIIAAKVGKDNAFQHKSISGIQSPTDFVSFGKFAIRKGKHAIRNEAKFVLEAPTVKKNAEKVARAMQLNRPILLEGDPGAGKTSIVAALAQLTGHRLVRINLSEQTDISDLFGSDLPDTEANSKDDTPRFRWHDGLMLKAIKDCDWILLDEMNLASQSVLEGLNACFDHRGEIYIPELDKRIIVDRNIIRIFACQNPCSQGAARKGLPQSFLNRFTSIYIDSHSDQDLSNILVQLYPELPTDMIDKMILFNKQVSAMFQVQGYEFNLRDLIYWSDLMTKYVRGEDFKTQDLYEPDRFIQFVYLDRMRSLSDRNDLCELFEKIFGYPVYEPPYRDIKLGEYSFVMTRSILPRLTRLPPHLSDSCILKDQMPYIESLAKAIETNKMPILVGEPGVGKRTMVKILAGLTGNELNVIGANSDMDTVELLGSFEQKSLQREIVDLVDEATKFTTTMINSIPRRNQVDSWTQLYKHIWSTLYATSIREFKLSKSEMMDAYRFQLAQMKELVEKMQPFSINRTEQKCKELRSKIVNLYDKFLFMSESTYSSGNFEWIDSVLIRSIREGNWLMIENANLLNPATLDRFNSLVEPNGSLSLNEKGSGPNGIEMLKPHPNFRLILTMSPEYGELSRAMRNRGVEIYVRTRFYFEDFLLLLEQYGFVPEEEKACMTYCIMQTSYDAHEKITGEKPENDGSLLAYFGLNYLSILANQIRRGVNVDTILADLIISYYHRKGYLESNTDPSISAFVCEKMNEYRATYVVRLNDDRYKWCHFRHDLVSLSGGDAIPAMLLRESKILLDFSCPIAIGLLKLDELIENYDVVVTCTSMKIFIEQSTHGDFDYRTTTIKDTFSSYPKIVDVVKNEFEALKHECLPMITSQMPTSRLAPVTEMYVDTRNSQDIHYYLQSLDYAGTLEREDLQNRWLLSLHRITLTMIASLAEENAKEDAPGNTSLWELSEKVRDKKMLPEDLIRPQAGVASELYDLLHGLLQVVSNRCLSSELVSKMMARFFWIGFLLLKLKKSHYKVELVALCNQLPMLWALTYQKVVMPIIEDCDLADLSYKGKKFSSRTAHICEALDVSVTKPSKDEKEYYSKILNLYAATTKRSEIVEREVDKFFNTLLSRYTIKSQSYALGTENKSTLAASNLVWSNSIYMSTLYRVSEILASLDHVADDTQEGTEKIKLMLEESRKLIVDKQAEYNTHENFVKTNDNYRSKCLTIHRRRCAFDQFAPIWQAIFIQNRLSKVNPTIEQRLAKHQLALLPRLLQGVNGVLMSPRYHNTLMKFLREIQNRVPETNNVSADESDIIETVKQPRNNFNMYAAFVVDHLLENIVLDNQIVGWMKMRVYTSDLSTVAPLIPEYSPKLSLVSSYCLDITHLKLNSYQSSSPQLDSMLMYLWRSYAEIKLAPKKEDRELLLVRNFIHLRCKLEDKRKLIGDYECTGTTNCCCIEEYVTKKASKFQETFALVKEKADSEDIGVFERAMKLIYFGFYTQLEYAPIFTLDPSLRSREKLEVYTAELAHTKADLHQRNTLHYWKTGENLRLVDISSEEAKLYPMSIRVLVERREKLEGSIKKLRREFTNRPKSDDGTLYYELRREVEISISRNTNNINALVNDLISYLNTKKPLIQSRVISSLTTKCRMLIKTLERSINRFKSDFVLYSDLTTNYLAGSVFILQGMRLLYSRLEQKMQLIEAGFHDGLVNKFARTIMQLFSFNNFTSSNFRSVHNKRDLYPILNAICPEDKVSYIQSLLLRSVLIQLNHHIVMTPSDIEQCIPIVCNIADKFHAAWLERKKYLEEQRQKQEDLYHYKTSHTTIGNQVSFERQEFIDICNKFPLYDHMFKDHVNVPATSDDSENLKTEEKIINLNRSVDLSMCIDVCKAHYKFMKEASLNLLGQQDSRATQPELRAIDMNPLIKLESEILYTIMRKCASNLSADFDSLSIECHLLQTNELIKLLRQTPPEQLQVGTLRGSIEILDEDIFDIYYSSSPNEVLKFQELLAAIDDRVNALRNLPNMGYDNHPLLAQISRLTERISSFLITDPLMTFVTGAHTLLQQLEEWNKNVPRDSRLTSEVDSLIELIKSWRALEIKSWRSSLHRVKRKYIDDTLCDLWFRLYEAFKDPLAATTKLLIEKEMVDEDFVLDADENFYQAFILLIKEFFEDATLGDFQIRLDLVFSFAIQTRFASSYDAMKRDNNESAATRIDYEKLTTYVYNIYRQYQGLMSSLGEILQKEESSLTTDLTTEIRIVNWQGRNLWEIKNNFRISHRKLNKVMNKYLEVLRRPVPSVRPQGSLSQSNPKPSVAINGDSTKLANKFDLILETINRVEARSTSSCPLQSLQQAPKMISKLQDLSKQIYPSAKIRYVGVLESFEQILEGNADSIKTFHSQRVQDLTIYPRDSKETRAEKMKTCRQIYHSKKYAMQLIFKNLQELGLSFQRGLNSSIYLDKSILSLEPLRGMIQNQCRPVLKAASDLVDDSLIIDCNDIYREIVTKNQLLLAQPRGQDLSGDQMERISGYAYDIVLAIIVHNRNAAIIYRHWMNIQAATTRLQQLRDQSNGGNVVIYNFARVHKTIKRFNELASRAFSSISKLEMLMDCFKTYSDLKTFANQIQSTDGENSREREILRDLIFETNAKFSLITVYQYEHLKQNLSNIRQSIAEVAFELRDKLKCSIRDHLYSSDDILHIQELYSKFETALGQFLPAGDDKKINVSSGTILGSMKLLRLEAEFKLKPVIKTEFLTGKLDQIEVDSHPNIMKLDIRLQKLIKQAKLAAQDIYKEERDFVNLKATSESAKRRMKPFNQIESSRIRDLLRPIQVANQVAKCFTTLNLEQRCTNVKPIVDRLAPIMLIYTQEVARYLNVILATMHTNLLTANQLIPFFTDLVLNGFGLPCKIQDLEGAEDGKANGAASEDNVGFGEGQGDKDASKKLEFESQLDELKKDEDEKNEDGQNGDSAPDPENIDAHDDGVEMSEDFDAKAQGPEEGEEKDQKDDKADSTVDDDDDILNDLDKEFDSVDQDEGNLDQDLWDDKDEPLGDDDEQDLRQADIDQSTKPDMDEMDLMAQNEDLQQSHAEGEAGAASESDNGDDGSGCEDETADSANLKDQGYDLDEGMESEPEADANDESAKEDTEMRVEGDEAGNEQDEGRSAEDEIDVCDDSEPGLIDMSVDVDEEPEGHDGNQDTAETMTTESEIDVDGVDEEEQKIGRSGPGAKGDDRNDDESAADGEQDDQQPSDRSESCAREDQSATAKTKQGEASDQADKPEGNDNDTEQDGDQAAAEDTAGKRTFADRNSIDQQQTLKRQKIESAVASNNKALPDNEQPKVDDAESVRHIEHDNDQAIEVIDLASDSDEELLDKGVSPEKIDQKQSIKPRSLDTKTGGDADGQGESQDQEDKLDDMADKQQQSSYNTNLGLLRYISHGHNSKENEQIDQNDAALTSELMERIDEVLKKHSKSGHESIATDMLTRLWLDCTKSTDHLVQELCQQLQIVLQPTKMSKYKGDYKSGKRLNMRKIISYIASHYRKDKIWLRRTKPCKRTYNISLAVDNSSSMAENNCRQMTYQSLALLAKSLSLIEAGSLNVVSFGEQVKCIHEFDQPYVDAIGAQWLRELGFDEPRTSYSSLLKHSCDSFAKQSQLTLAARQQLLTSSQQVSVNQLLVIISDGRNITSESDEVKCYLRQLKSMGVLTLFVIIDDLKQNKTSIVDVQVPTRVDGALRMEGYLNLFPFPFYVLLRQLDSMPSVLGEALRQWFELVSNS